MSFSSLIRQIDLLLPFWIVPLFLSHLVHANSTFPKNFKWCVATAAHQIEGNNIHSDWWQWENKAGKIKNGDKSGIATNSHAFFEDDLAALKKINARTYRLSIEWAKIEPKPYQYDEEVLSLYKHQLKRLREEGIEPMVTLQHFTLPLWVAEKGGWESKTMVRDITRYTAKVYSVLGNYVTDWVTINEPTAMLLGGYGTGVFPPGKMRQPLDLLKPLMTMIQSHMSMYNKLHELGKLYGNKVRAGVAYHIRPIDPFNPLAFFDITTAAFADYYNNWAFSDALETGTLNVTALGIKVWNEKLTEQKHMQDFFGLNYYTGNLIQFSPLSLVELISRTALPKSDAGLDIFPEGFYRIIKEVHKRYPQLPIMITENGIADANDSLRPQFIIDHVNVVEKAIGEGIPVEGYCHWSLMDNFEWQEGYSLKFGLFSIEPETLRRIPRRSAEVFSKIAHQMNLSGFSHQNNWNHIEENLRKKALNSH